MKNEATRNSSFFILHSSFLLRCLDLARVFGAGVEPNPRVGAVVVQGGRIIGEGAHEFFGGPHAEVNAIRSVKQPELLRESTLYVSLEPCNHHGKTPPCTQLILDSGIPHVVVRSVDPNPQMSGKSIAFLRERGVEVEVLDDQSAFVELNRHFWVNQLEKRPYVLLKWAESADGFIAGLDTMGRPQPRAISCAETNRHFHWFRHELQAIWVGKNTALVDNPSLTTRLWPGRNPLRIVFDDDLSLPHSLNIFQGGQTIIINSKKDAEEGNLRFWKVDDSRDLAGLLARMYNELKIGSVLVEGGQNLSQQFLEAGIWDAVVRCTSPIRLGWGVKAPVIPGNLKPHVERVIGVDRIEYFNCGGGLMAI